MKTIKRFEVANLNNETVATGHVLDVGEARPMYQVTSDPAFGWSSTRTFHSQGEVLDYLDANTSTGFDHLVWVWVM